MLLRWFREKMSCRWGFSQPFKGMVTLNVLTYILNGLRLLIKSISLSVDTLLWILSQLIIKLWLCVAVTQMGLWSFGRPRQVSLFHYWNQRVSIQCMSVLTLNCTHSLSSQITNFGGQYLMECTELYWSPMDDCHGSGKRLGKIIHERSRKSQRKSTMRIWNSHNEKRFMERW